MLQAQAQTPVYTVPAAVRALPSATQPAKRVAAHVSFLEIKFRSIDVDGTNLWREHHDVAIGQLAEALRQADLHGKPELNIDNISPQISVGDADTAQIPIIQRKIERFLAAASKKLNREMPVCRLDLHNGQFGIRCYLGRMKPTDFIFGEDLMSDSR